MALQAQYIPYRNTGAFSAIVLDYLDQNPSLYSFYQFAPDRAGIQKAISERGAYPVDRSLLAEVLTRQYASMPSSEVVMQNIQLLTDEKTYTICTAHQPNIFTGHLYVIYKILHAVRLAEELREALPGNHFVPVYYMGSEDADLDELGEVFIGGKSFQWNTKQTGAVGRMIIDQSLLKMIDEIEGQLLVEPHGKELMDMLRSCYSSGKSIETATFDFMHRLFGHFGLIVFLPDRPEWKKAFSRIIEDELLNQFSQPQVSDTVSRFPKQYKVQAAGRDINLFYLTGELRERIVYENDQFRVANTGIVFSKESILTEIQEHPERFSPNVILRPLLQELLLPNVAFIGGGGELAYWLEFRQLFQKAAVFYPALILRNSFLMIPAHIRRLMEKHRVSEDDLFKTKIDLVNEVVSRQSVNRLHLDPEMASMKDIYKQISVVADKVDPTLKNHVENLQAQAFRKIEALEKKLMRSEKRKAEATVRQIEKIRDILFPAEALQERVDNILPYLSVYGIGLIDKLYAASTGSEQQFCILDIG